MNRLGTTLVALAAVIAMVLSGCDLLTKNNAERTATAPGKELIVNEVFTISPDKYYAYSWIELYNPTNRPIRWFDQTFPATGTAVGTSGEIDATTDDGINWADPRTDGSLGNLNSINFPNPDTAFLCGDGGKLYKMNANGITSLAGGLPAGHDYSKLNFYSIAGIHSYVGPSQVDRRIQALFVVGDSGLIFRSFNVGATWAQTPPPRTAGAPRQTIRNIFTDFEAKNFFIVGDSGMFYQSTNAGTNWIQKTIPEPYRGTRFNCCWFVDTLGWAVGDNGTILTTTNTGTVWSAETTNVSASLRGCFFAPPRSSGPRGVVFVNPGTTGWIVGDNGTILRTEDKGKTWIHVPSGTSARLNSVYFVDSLRGWIFGNGGVILGSSDGGRSWLQQQSGTTADLRAAHFLPLSVIVQNGYYLSMHAQRSFVFYDAATNTLNFDFVTRTDTGLVLFQPQRADIQVPPGGFVVITNDSIKFHDHTKLGPGQTTLINFGFGVDTSGSSQPGYNPLAHLLKWSLLPGSEIRIIKFFFHSVGGVPVDLTTKVIDVVRWGGYRPTPDDYPNNVPAGIIPEYWSLARYNNDPGEDPNVESTENSFYMSDDPLPGWYSQQGR